jgi:hypothetical protein
MAGCGRGRTGWVRARAVVLVAVLVAAGGCAQVVRSSVSNTGTQGNAWSFGPALSDDGRFIAFASEASNLVPGDTNASSDVFVRDHQTNAITRVSLADDESQANGYNGVPSISDDGRFVAFVSNATNLVSGTDTNGTSDAFVRDTVVGSTRRLTTNGASSATISGNGRHVVYVQQTETTPNFPLESVVSYDLVSGSTVTVASDTIQPPLEPGFFHPVSVSDDGAFVSYRFSVRHGDTNITFTSISLWTRATGAVRSIASAVSPALVDGGDISGDGHFVTFQSSLDVLGEPDLCAVAVGARELPPECDSDVFVWDRLGNSYEAVAPPAAPGVDDQHSAGRLSDDGRTVTFLTSRPDLPRETVQWFARDRRTGAVQALGAPADPGSTDTGALSGDGWLFAIGTDRPLAGNDSNLVFDIYTRRTFVPSLTTAAPVTVAAGGAPVTVTFHSDGFEPGVVVAALGAGVAFTNIHVVDATTLAVTVTAQPGAATGPRGVFSVHPARFPAAGVGTATPVCVCLTVA